MNEPNYEIQLTWDPEDEIYVATIPSIPGCMAHGVTKTEAIKSAQAAIELWIETARDDGIPIPEPAESLEN